MVYGESLRKLHWDTSIDYLGLLCYWRMPNTLTHQCTYQSTSYSPANNTCTIQCANGLANNRRTNVTVFVFVV
jgi:hypothetical protein